MKGNINSGNLRYQAKDVVFVLIKFKISSVKIAIPINKSRAPSVITYF